MSTIAQKRASPRRPAPKQAYHHGNLREALVKAALELIVVRGARGLALREVARQAGVSHAAPYRHFPDREALLAAVAEEGFRTLCRTQLERRARGQTPIERFQACGEGYVAFATSHPAHFAVMFGSEINHRDRFPSLLAAGQEAFNLLLDSVLQCQEAGALQAGNTLLLALAAWSAVHGLSALRVENQIPSEAGDPQELFGFLAEVLQRGLGPK